MDTIEDIKVQMHLEHNIRARRGRLGLSLEALAKKSGVSRAMLSEVERGNKSPTIHLLCLIAAGLSCTVSELLGEEQPRRVHVLRADERPTVRDEDGVERQVLSISLMHHGLEAVWYVIPPGQSAGPFPPEALGIVEHITVINGKLSLDYGDECVPLETGDSVTYRIDETVFYRNTGRITCRLFLLIDKSHLKRRNEND
ncbi:MAG: XRE family transcriptional regulator [Planctomycetota bacterium]|nr:XRE family transcriptional regulator [Planctomycetota bacterium]